MRIKNLFKSIEYYDCDIELRMYTIYPNSVNLKIIFIILERNLYFIECTFL